MVHSHSLSRFVLTVLCVCGLFAATASVAAAAADVLLTPASGSYSNGQTFTVTVQVDPKGQQVNAVEANLKFDPKVLSVVSTAKTGSAFSLWTTEPAFSNTAGTITFGGGSPTPFAAKSALLSITFRALGEGSGAVSFNSASVLAADGKGTDVIGAKTGATYTVAGATPTPTPAPTPTPTPTPTPEPREETKPEDNNAAIAFGDPPRAPEVGSQAFLDPEVWYNLKAGLFTWELPFDVTAVAIALATSSDFVPSSNKDNINDPPVEDFNLTPELVVDGIQYLSVQYKNQVGWGAVNNRKVMIDTTAPEPFTINVRTGTNASTFPTLVFEAPDKTSGIERYEFIIADREPVTITPDEAKLGYLLGELEDGTYTAKVTAYDKAGNSTVSTVAVLITAGWIKPLETEEEVSFWSYLTGKNILLTILMLLVLMQIAYIYFDRKQRTATEQKLRKETKEIQDQMGKIFSALRDEIYDQINLISKRPRLSQKEKEAVEQLNQALEVSETLIEKEINDVKSILK